MAKALMPLGCLYRNTVGKVKQEEPCWFQRTRGHDPSCFVCGEALHIYDGTLSFGGVAQNHSTLLEMHVHL